MDVFKANVARSRSPMCRGSVWSSGQPNWHRRASEENIKPCSNRHGNRVNELQHKLSALDAAEPIHTMRLSHRPELLESS